MKKKVLRYQDYKLQKRSQGLLSFYEEKMDRLYRLIIDDEELVFEPEREYVYIVKRELHGLEFVFKTRALAIKCTKRLAEIHPDEADYISIHKMIVRTEY